MSFWLDRIVALHGRDGTTSIFDTIARLALSPPSPSAFWSKTADAVASTDTAPSGSPIPQQPAETRATAALVADAPSSTPASASPGEAAQQSMLARLIEGRSPAYRQSATGDVYAVYNLGRSPEFLRALVPDHKERYALLASSQPKTFEYEETDGSTYTIRVGQGGQIQVARKLSDEEYADLDPRNVRPAAVRVQQPGMAGAGGFGGGDPFFMMLPMIYQMMMMTDPQYSQMMRLQAMMMQQMMMRQMMAYMMSQGQAHGRPPFV